MHDRVLISLSDDLEVLVSRQVNDVESVWGLVNKTRRAAVPGNPAHPVLAVWCGIWSLFNTASG
jgi:putative restriction endonuclease